MNALNIYLLHMFRDENYFRDVLRFRDMFVFCRHVGKFGVMSLLRMLIISEFKMKIRNFLLHFKY